MTKWKVLKDTALFRVEQEIDWEEEAKSVYLTTAQAEAYGIIEKVKEEESLEEQFNDYDKCRTMTSAGQNHDRANIAKEFALKTFDDGWKNWEIKDNLSPMWAVRKAIEEARWTQ